MYFIIDGLARSGTTLLTSSLHSQAGISCYRGVCHEFLYYGGLSWPFEHANYPIVTGDIAFNKSLVRRINQFNCRAFKKSILKQFDRKNQYGRISREQLKQLLEVFEIENFNSIDTFYDGLRRINADKALGFRWNQGISWVDKWTERPNHFWLNVIRDPVARAISAQKAFNWPLEMSIKTNQEYARKVQESEGKIFNIYYEDLIVDPETVIKNACNYIGLDFNKVSLELESQTGSKYRTESSDLVAAGKKHTEGIEFQGFDLNYLNKYDEQSKSLRKDFEELANFELYKRYF